MLTDLERREAQTYIENELLAELGDQRRRRVLGLVLEAMKNAPNPTLEPDMFWDDDDPEMAEESVNEIICDGGPGDLYEIQCAYRLPNLLVRVIEVPQEGADPEIDYEIVAEGSEAIRAARVTLGVGS